MKGYFSKKVIGRLCAGMVTATMLVGSFGAYVSAEEDFVGDEIVAEEATEFEVNYDDDVATEEAENIDEIEAVADSSTEIIEDNADTALEDDSEEVSEMAQIDAEYEEDAEVVSLISGGVEYSLSGGGYTAVTYTGTSGSIYIPEQIGDYYVTAIADNFLYNKAAADIVTSVSIPYTVTKIGKNAFRECSKLQSVSFGTHEERDYSTFLYWVTVTHLDTIGEYAFYGDSLLTEINLYADGLKKIESYAFAGCSGIKNLKIAGTVTTIGVDAFKDLESLENFSFYGDIDRWMGLSFGSNSKGTHPNAYAKTVLIGEKNDDGWGYSSTNCKEVTSVNVPQTKKEIGGYLFANFKKLTNINLSHINKIYEGAFYNCSSIENVTLGTGLDTLEAYAFYGNAKLQTINIGVGVSEIGSKAFYGCKVLNNITVEKNVDTIAADAFEGCDGLKKAFVYYNTSADRFFSNVEGCFVMYLDTVDGDNDQLDANLVGYSAVFNGRIGMQFYFTVANPKATDYVNFIVPTEEGRIEKAYYFSEAEKDMDRANTYIFTIYFAPKYADQKVTAKIESASVTNGKTYQISFYDYATLLIKFSTKYQVGDKSNLIKALLKYCDAVQQYLGYGADSIDTSAIDFTVSNIDSSYAANITDSDYLGMSMVVDDVLTINLYYKGIRTDLGIDTADSALNANVKKEYGNGYTILRISGFDFTAKKSGNTLSFKRKLNITSNGADTGDYFYGISYSYSAYISGNEKLSYLGLAVENLYQNAVNKDPFYIKK